jgi:2-keto-4-pentenoate hydratase
VTAPSAVIAAADRLTEASALRAACAPVSEFIGGTDIDVAYRVQQTVTQRRVHAGARIVGRKIGLTSSAVQRQIGVDRPDFGVLFDDMAYADGTVIPMERLLQPKAEAEVAFELGQDILDATDADAVRAAVALAYPALEIVDSRIANWRIGITDTVADNASSGVFVLGSTGTALSAFEPVDVRMSMWRDDEQVSEGSGADCLGDPLAALAWLAATAIEFGDPLRSGDIVLSGALGPMVDVSAGDVFRARIEPLGEVTARFSGRSTDA